VTSRYNDHEALSRGCRASPTKYDQYTLIFHSVRGDGGKGTNGKDEGICLRTQGCLPQSPQPVGCLSRFRAHYYFLFQRSTVVAVLRLAPCSPMWA